VKAYHYGLGVISMGSSGKKLVVVLALLVKQRSGNLGKVVAGRTAIGKDLGI
jgi:hypothetical protein